MNNYEAADRLIDSRRGLVSADFMADTEKSEAEGGCGVIGLASSEPVAGRHLLTALTQMRNRGNGKGGGIAAVGLDASELGVTPELLADDYILSMAYLDDAVRGAVEEKHVNEVFEVDHMREVPHRDPRDIPNLTVRPPDVTQYFVRVRPKVLQAFRAQNGLDDTISDNRIGDEIVFQNTYSLNRDFYSAEGQTRAFVLSHGRDMMVLKMVGYGDDVVRYYNLEDVGAKVWIGHHRYPTKGRVWHPGGAHPFIGMHEALVHNGDFANYHSISEYLAQRNIHPLFLTDTEVAVQVFDLFHRVYGYPLEYVIEALAPTTERDFAKLPPEKQRIYQAIQTTHMHASPDGPWFFLIAQSLAEAPNGHNNGSVKRLIGITDTSMLRPQVFALQKGESSAVGFAASEKQAIDAALESLASEKPDVYWRQPDKVWNARGGSHTDGGAFSFTVRDGKMVCTDKFGRKIEAVEHPSKWRMQSVVFDGRRHKLENALETHLAALEETASRDDENRQKTIASLTSLLHTHAPFDNLRPSIAHALIQESLNRVFDSCHNLSYGENIPPLENEQQTLVIDAKNFPPEGDDSLAMALVRSNQAGWQNFIVYNARGQRFIGDGIGPDTKGVVIDVYGSSGDYLASGIDGAKITVYGNGQDQLGQIMKSGQLVVHGDVGQTFMYGAKGGEAYVLGNVAGRALINAVGKPRVVINGTALDYLAESFMAGDPLHGGGFVVINGVRFNEEGEIEDLEEPYPGGNLFSLASGGAIYIRDPHNKVDSDQLNGGEFVELTEADWHLLQPYLEKNAELFDIPVSRLLTANGVEQNPLLIYRKIRPKTIRALQAEEAWAGKGH